MSGDWKGDEGDTSIRTMDDCRALQLSELYDLLTNNYVEDDDEMFRFNYKMEFLRWCV